MFISEQYRRTMREMLISGWGKSAYKKAPHISELSYVLKVESMLDYGCGQGSLFLQLKKTGWWGLDSVEFAEYDPCVLSRSQFPTPADMVLCLDVLEHVEKEYLDHVILHTWALAKKYLLVSVSLCDADLILPDGRNAHITVQPEEWWRARFADLLRGASSIVDVRIADKSKPEWSFLAIRNGGNGVAC